MYWTLELASKLDDAPWPATKDELIDFAQRTCAPMEVIENLQEIEDEGESYESIEEIWPDYPSKEDFFFNEEEYWLSTRFSFLIHLCPDCPFGSPGIFVSSVVDFGAVHETIVRVQYIDYECL